MQAHLSTLTFDPDGAVTINLAPEARMGESRRRVNRIPTLDGSAVVNDFGYSDADRTIRLQWVPVSNDYEANIERMVQTNARLHIATADGFFLAAPESYEPRTTQSVLVLLVLAKLSA